MHLVGIDVGCQRGGDLAFRGQRQHQRLEGVIDGGGVQDPGERLRVSLCIGSAFHSRIGGEDERPAQPLARFPAVEAITVVLHQEHQLITAVGEAQLDRRREAAQQGRQRPVSGHSAGHHGRRGQCGR